MCRSNALAANPLPRTLLVGPKLSIMDRCISDLDVVLQKLVQINFLLSVPPNAMFTAEAIPQDDHDHRFLRGSSCRGSQNQRVQMGTRRASMDHLATGKIWCVSINAMLRLNI